MKTPARWMGSLRREVRANSIQSSTSIEGFSVSPEEALALTSGAGAADDSDENRQEYIGPDADLIVGLMSEVVDSLIRSEDDDKVDVVVKAAMARLNVISVHPFRNGKRTRLADRPIPRPRPAGHRLTGVLLDRGVPRLSHPGLLRCAARDPGRQLPATQERRRLGRLLVEAHTWKAVAERN